jgi:PAS domain S-box-containing protein
MFNIQNHIDEILDTNVMITAVIDKNMKVLYLNKGLEKLLGKDKKHIINRNCIRFVPKQFENQVIKIIKKAFINRNASQQIVPILAKGNKIKIICWKSHIIKSSSERYLVLMGNDITDEMHMKNNLSASNSYLASVINNSFALIYIKDLRGRYLMINKAWKVYKGIPLDNIIGKTDHQLFSKKTAAIFRKNDAIVIRNKKARYETSEFSYQGKTHCHHTVKYPLFDSKEKIIGICGISHDITLRKNIEKENKIFRQFFEQSNEGMALVKLNGTIIDLNPAWLKMHGYSSKKQFLEKSWRKFHTESQYRKDVVPFLKGTIANKPVARYIGHKKKNNQVFHASSIASVLKDKNGKAQGIICLIRDVTERLKASELLRKNEYKYRTLFDNVSMGVYRVKADKKGTLIDVNNSLVKILGYSSKKELINTYAKDLYVKEKDRKIFFETVRKNKHCLKQEILLKKRDGNEIIAADTCTAVRDEKGKIIYYDGILEDITGKKQMEAKLEEYAKHLEKMVLDRTADVVEESRKAVAANELKTMFLANISHELRTPLTSIIGYTELLEETTQSDSEKSANMEYVNIIKKNAAHLLQLITETLDLTKIEQRKMPIEKERCKIKDILKDIETTFRPLFQKKGITLDIDIQKKLPATIVTDEQKMRQILFNLVSNALKFTTVGKVSIGVKKVGNNISFQVKDTGIGMTDQDIQCLFEPYHRSKHPLVRRQEGSGLGLAITKKLITLLGGNIYTSSCPGEGSSFTASIPHKS